MKTLREERKGRDLLRLVETASGYSGIVLTNRAVALRIDGKDAGEV